MTPVNERIAVRNVMEKLAAVMAPAPPNEERGGEPEPDIKIEPPKVRSLPLFSETQPPR